MNPNFILLFGDGSLEWLEDETSALHFDLDHRQPGMIKILPYYNTTNNTSDLLFIRAETIEYSAAFLIIDQIIRCFFLAYNDVEMNIFGVLDIRFDKTTKLRCFFIIF